MTRIQCALKRKKEKEKETEKRVEYNAAATPAGLEYVKKESTYGRDA